MSSEFEREDLCKKCGNCCYHKIKFFGKVYIDTTAPCQYLDTQTRLCKVYEKRHEVEPLCLKITDALQRGVMPKECGYVEEYIKLYGSYDAPAELI
jgi:hypothetical protein